MNVIAMPRRHPAGEQPSPNSGLLRFITAGSVDDGKSTLIGRLLFDTGNVPLDQLESVRNTSKSRGLAELDWSLLTDGLQAEREQGITIDVAYRYFATPQRTFIIGDAPGHEQYTRNMVTAASTADLAILLVDARKGIVTQTRRHSYLAHLLGVEHIVLAVNKMDLIDWSQERYDEIVAAYRRLADEIGIGRFLPIPLSSLTGANLARPAELDWYEGPTLLEHLESVQPRIDLDNAPLRLPVQRVARVMLGNRATASEVQEFRGYQGTLAAGRIAIGDCVTVLPSRQTAVVRSLRKGDRLLTHAGADDAVVVELDRELDVSRGDLLAAPDHLPCVTREVIADLCWLVPEPLEAPRKYRVKHTTRTVTGIVTELIHRVDVESLTLEPAPTQVPLNGIARVRLKLQQALFVDRYCDQRTTGSFILIDEVTDATVAGGTIVHPIES